MELCSIDANGVFVLLCLLSAVHGIHLDRVIVPNHLVVGEIARLTCNYSLENELLYSIKWYKGSHELFRFRPRNDPPMQLFELPGIYIDREASNEKDLVLKYLTLKAAGSYRCEVSEESTFLTVSEKADLYVIDLPDEDPLMTGLRSAYPIGHYLKSNCTSFNSFPASNLTWYINDEEADDKIKVKYPILKEGELYTSILGLHFQIRRKHFRNKQMKLSCRAQIQPRYDRIQWIVVSELVRTTSTVTFLESRNLNSNLSSGRKIPTSGLFLVVLSTFFLTGKVFDVHFFIL